MSKLIGAVCVGENKRKEGWQFVPKTFTKLSRVLLKYAKGENSLNKLCKNKKVSPTRYSCIEFNYFCIGFVGCFFPRGILFFFFFSFLVLELWKKLSGIVTDHLLFSPFEERPMQNQWKDSEAILPSCIVSTPCLPLAILSKVAVSCFRPLSLNSQILKYIPPVPDQVSSGFFCFLLNGVILCSDWQLHCMHMGFIHLGLFWVFLGHIWTGTCFRDSLVLLLRCEPSVFLPHASGMNTVSILANGSLDDSQPYVSSGNYSGCSVKLFLQSC